MVLGLASAGLTAVAGAKTWAEPGASAQELGGAALMAQDDAWSAESPLAGALALVVLAVWGVLLVTRGRVRRLVAVLGLVAAAGLAATTVVALVSMPDQLRDQVEDQWSVSSGVDPTFTGWFWTALVCSLLAVATLAVAVWWAPSWPEMGTRYDAPGGDSGDVASTERTNLDLWKAMDEGEDPTS